MLDFDKKPWEIEIPPSIIMSMKQYGASQPDQEVCGLLTGYFIDSEKFIVVEEFLPIRNIAPDPLGLFIMEPYLQLQCMKDATRKGMNVVGCFHSHPHNLGIPSSTDARMINENYAWLIWGGQDDELRAWYPIDHKDPSQGFDRAIVLNQERRIT